MSFECLPHMTSCDFRYLWTDTRLHHLEKQSSECDVRGATEIHIVKMYYAVDAPNSMPVLN